MELLKQSRDEELVQLYKDGNERAFDELYSRYTPKLKRLIYYYVSNAEEVNDIFHDVFIRVVRHIESFNTTMSFSSWIYQIAVNCSKNYLGKNYKDTMLLEKEKFRITRDEDKVVTPEENLLAKDDEKAFNEAVDLLKDKFKDVFILRYDHNLKYQDISKILNCSERTAKWRMKVAIETITVNLKEMGVI